MTVQSRRQEEYGAPSSMFMPSSDMVDVVVGTYARQTPTDAHLLIRRPYPESGRHSPVGVGG